mmetsp:Transcript_21479/g.47039  ORF Transcript_21479/g.47039 Transcript_21479/m.47039 type:complete len:293 (+) Transcript_21479:2409-3287(+)
MRGRGGWWQVGAGGVGRQAVQVPHWAAGEAATLLHLPSPLMCSGLSLPSGLPPGRQLIQPGRTLLATLLQHLQQRTRHRLVLRGQVRGGGTATTGTASATDPVHILIHLSGHVEVDDVAHVRDVHAAASDAGGHQDGCDAELEALHRLVALHLGQVSVQQRRLVPGTDQQAVDLDGRCYCVGEHQCQALSLGHVLQQALAALLRRQQLNTLCDEVRAGVLLPHPHADRVQQEVCGQPPHLRRQRGAEHERLALERRGHARVGHQPPHLRLKAQVQHLVRLVHHQHPHALQPH